MTVAGWIVAALATLALAALVRTTARRSKGRLRPGARRRRVGELGVRIGSILNRIGRL